MWFIQAPVDGLTLPADTRGQVTLAGTVAPWHHIIRNCEPHAQKSAALLAASALRWSIAPWQRRGTTVFLPETMAARHELEAMVRAEPQRACARVTFSDRGKREADAMLHVEIIVPPEQFQRYETLLQFAMTLPSGTVSLTVPVPVPVLNDSTATDAPVELQLLAPGGTCLVEGLEMVVSRARPVHFTRRNLQSERRAARAAETPDPLVHPDGDEWFTFRRDEQPAGGA